MPPHTQHTTGALLAQLDNLEGQIETLQRRIEEVLAAKPENELLRSIPGVGSLLSVVIACEIGRIGRFPRAEQLPSYAGTTPRVHSSGGKTRYGPLRSDVNRTLKYAFMEAANSIALNGKRKPSRLYFRIKGKKRTCQSHRRGGPPLGRGHVLDFKQERAVQRTGFAHEGISASSS